MSHISWDEFIAASILSVSRASPYLKTERPNFANFVIVYM